jgi:hypothetical protein
MNWDIVLGIVGIIAAFLIVRFLFQNFFTSRVLCLACCGAAIHQAFTASPDGIAGCCILCILGWLFYRGENNFDFEYTGWVTYYSDGTSEHESIGGFFRHALTTIVVMGLVFYFLVPQWGALMWLIPGGILALDILSFGFFLLDR